MAPRDDVLMYCLERMTDSGVRNWEKGLTVKMQISGHDMV